MLRWLMIEPELAVADEMLLRMKIKTLRPIISRPPACGVNGGRDINFGLLLENGK